jgi:transglutaminase-like putative cysteine protease
MIYRITHLTRYQYPQAVSLCYNQGHLEPRDTERQRCLDTHISISPQPATLSQHRDYFGNRCFNFSVHGKHHELMIKVVSEVSVDAEQARREPELDLGGANDCAQALEKLSNRRDENTLLAREFALNSPMVRAGDALREYAAPSFAADRPLLAAVRDLNHRIYSDFTYDPEFSTIATPLDEVLEHRRGVCQDFAHLAIGCLRSLGYPARYVSGYLETQPAPGQAKLVGSDASHAWFAVYSPGEGWFEFDPTNDNMPAGQHITTAWGRDYSDVTPLRGVIFEGGSSQVLKVSVDVARVEG